ncbi:MAG: T9SS type A sorting domain-containing protein, partial [Ignavibacteriaceae bacterium]|nr:T9SS type A sorting domain-containing protein [Ignavibacteriaceae bacterium]
MKKVFVLFLFLGFVIIQNAQTITGKLVDQTEQGLAGFQLKLYINPEDYTTTSATDGSFIFNNITDVKKENELPTEYSVSNNYPNPFNPKTRIGIQLPNSGSVRISLYNLVGQKVIEEIERNYGAGTNYIDLELNGLPNGIYFARITLDEKYTVTKKMLLMYGSQHLSVTNSSSSSFSKLSKSALETKIDSLVVTDSSISKKVFTNLPSWTGSSLNLGNLIIGLPPQIPTLVVPANNAVDISIQPTLFWNTSLRATVYNLQASANIDFSTYVYNQSGLTNTNQQITGLSNSTPYYWKVSATNSYGTSAYSTPWSFTTLGTAPASPVLATPTNNAVDISVSPTLTWNASATATSYTLQVSTKSDFSSFVYNQSIGNLTSQQITGLSNLTPYYWKVSATNSYGTSAYSTPW